MSPETIITQLEQINSWRRGEESEPQPDPKHVGEVIDAAVASLRSLIASNTTLRRERGDASALLATSKAGNASLVENVRQLCAELGQSHALRARVAELERDFEMQTTRCIEREDRLAQAEVCIRDREKCNAELVAALQDAQPMAIAWANHYQPGEVHPMHSGILERIAVNLARAESAAPEGGDK